MIVIIQTVMSSFPGEGDDDFRSGHQGRQPTLLYQTKVRNTFARFKMIIIIQTFSAFRVRETTTTTGQATLFVCGGRGVFNSWSVDVVFVVVG
jgi:hypothetical protein